MGRNMCKFQNLCNGAIVILIWNGFSALATVYDSDGSSTNVQSIHDTLAQDGDTITLPIGIFTWSTRVYVTKGVTILGTGVENTTIVSNVPYNATQAAFYVESGTKPVRISGFTAQGGPNDIKGFITMQSQGFRIDHINFTINFARAIQAFSKPASYGVIDHCTFNKSPSAGSVQGVSIFGDGDAAWNRPLSLGTINAVYMEDCTFDWPTPADSVIDIYNGARAVFRHNTVSTSSVGCHGLDSGHYRSPVSWEIYENTFLVTIPLANQIYFRGRTGVVFNNTVVTSGNGRLSSNGISLTYYRATGTCIFPNYTPWGFVTGTNPYDGNTDAYGWPALDQIGAAPPTNPPNISVSPPPVYSVQGHSPAYAWETR
jgi:hypothetical protein